MEVKVLAFGQMAEAIGDSSFELEHVSDTNMIKAAIEAKYPATANIPYVIALNKKMVKENTELADGATVALLPPFSGG